MDENTQTDPKQEIDTGHQEMKHNASIDSG
jgi:hypothetical protein